MYASGLAHICEFMRPLARGSVGLLLVGLSGLAWSGCDKESGRPSEGASHSNKPNVGFGAISAEDLEALRADVRRSLKDELTPAVRDELRRELMPIVRAELAAEGRRPAGPATTDVVDTTPRPAGPPATPGTPGADGKADPWSEPGTHIWPSGGGLKLVELVVGTSLEEKLPTDIKTHYPVPPEILYCYSVFENPEPDATVTHVWRRGSRLVSRVELEVGRSPKWRTWSKQRTQPHWTGLWSCEVLDRNGQQLGLTVFQIGG